MVSLRLAYCNIVYMGLPFKTTYELQLVQLTVAQLLSDATVSGIFSLNLARFLKDVHRRFHPSTDPLMYKRRDA